MPAPTTDLAMLDRLRIGIAGDRSGDGAFKTTPDVPIVGGIIGDPVSFRRIVGTRRNHEGGDRFGPLRLRKQVRVQGYLEDRIALRLPCEFGVDYFVAPGAETARPRSVAGRGRVGPPGSET